MTCNLMRKGTLVCRKLIYSISTPGRRQTLILSTNVVRNRVFDCHLSPDWRQMAIEKTVSSDFFYPRSSIVKNVFDCHISSVISLCFLSQRRPADTRTSLCIRTIVIARAFLFPHIQRIDVDEIRRITNVINEC